jgi:hypothetical protein
MPVELGADALFFLARQQGEVASRPINHAPLPAEAGGKASNRKMAPDRVYSRPRSRSVGSAPGLVQGILPIASRKLPTRRTCSSVQSAVCLPFGMRSLVNALPPYARNSAPSRGPLGAPLIKPPVTALHKLYNLSAQQFYVVFSDFLY